MSEFVPMLDDKREIDSIWGPEDSWAIRTGKSCDRIEVYGEPGEFCMMPWFAIWKDGCISRRINAQFVANVNYKDKL